MIRTGTNTNLRLALVAITVIAIGTGVWVATRPRPTTLYQSEIIARNIRFPSISPTSRESKLRYFTGSAFAELDLATQSSVALSKEFVLPSVEQVEWHEAYADFQAKTSGNDDLARLGVESNWWRITFNTNEISKSTKPKSLSMLSKGGKVEINRPAENLKVTQADNGLRASIKLTGSNRRGYTAELDGKFNNPSGAALLSPSPGRELLAISDESNNLIVLSANDKVTFNPVPFVVFNERIVDFTVGYMEYDFLKNQAVINVYPNSDADATRKEILAKISKLNTDPHQLTKIWREVTPESD